MIMAAVQNKKTAPPATQVKAVQNKKNLPPTTPPSMKKGGKMKGGGKMC